MSLALNRVANCLVAVLAAAVGLSTVHAQTAVSRSVPPKSYAFLVACSEYDKRELNKLEFTLQDVQEFYQVLLASGFAKENIVLMHDNQPRDLLPEGRKIREQLDLLLARVDHNATLVVALSGHGVQFEGRKGNYFCPLDARLAEPGTLISLDEVYQQLEACSAQRKLLLVDACRNNPQSNLARSRAVVKLDMAKPQEENIPNGIVALFSCSAGQQSYEHPQLKHGVFFYHMLQAWKGAGDSNRDARLTLDELLHYTKEETETFAHLELKAKQIPHFKGDFTGSWLLRELPALPTGPDGMWRITSAASFAGKPYGGRLRIQSDKQGVYRLTWLNDQDEVLQAGIGFFESGRLYAAWGAETIVGINFYKIRSDGSLVGRWTHLANTNTVGSEWTGAGTPEGGGQYTGSLSIARQGETYSFTWRNSNGTPYYGIGLLHGDTVAVGWALEGAQSYGVTEYSIDGATARGRWTMYGQSKLSHENLTREHP
jgi:hypothetical protein